MKKRKQWAKMFALVLLAAALLTGCCNNEWSGKPLFEAKPIPVTIVEQGADMPAESAGERFGFGDVVYAVRTNMDGGGAYVVRYTVIADIGDVVAVVPMFTTDMGQLWDSLIGAAQEPLDGSGFVELVTPDNCYGSQEAAWAAAEEPDAL